MKRFFLTLAIVLVSINANAETDEFVSKNYWSLTAGSAYYTEPDGFDTTAYMMAISVGHELNDYLSIETRLGFGLTDGTETVYINPYIYTMFFSLDSLYGVYGKGCFILSRGLEVYGIAGFTKVNASFQIAGIKESDSDSGISYGFGFGCKLKPHLKIKAEYMSYLDEIDYDFKSLELGIVREF